jgi:hypothetical protein
MNCLTNTIKSSALQQPEPTGATDVTITTPGYVYVVEPKTDSTPKVALKQIDEKQYAVPYMGGKHTSHPPS